MAEYIAGRGTTALGIIGTVLGGLGTLGAGGGLMYGANGAGAFEARYATMHDIEDDRRLAEKDAEIGMLKAERYADAVRDDAKQYGIEVYKELKKDITDLKDIQNMKWTEQMVANSHFSDAITALDGKASGTAALVAQITRTAVPQSAICNFGGGCSSCGNNV